MTTSSCRSDVPTLPLVERGAVQSRCRSPGLGDRLTNRSPAREAGGWTTTMTNKVSIPMVGQQGDLLVIDGEEYIIERPTGAVHYLTLRSVEDPDRHEQFASAGEFTEWWTVRDSVELVRERAHSEEAAVVEDQDEVEA